MEKSINDSSFGQDINSKLLIEGIEAMPNAYRERLNTFLDSRRSYDGPLTGTMEDVLAWCFLDQDSFGYSINMNNLSTGSSINIMPVNSQSSPREILLHLQLVYGLRISVSDGMIRFFGKGEESSDKGLK